MVKIAITLSDNGNVMDFIDYPYSMNQKGSNLIFVEKPIGFSIDNMYEWTVRESDNTLVHISTGLTPDEETKASLADLTKDQLKGQLMDNQVQQAITTMTKQAIQDKLTSQMSITELTKQVADLTVKLDKANGVDSAPETPTDVTSTATNDGATITAK